MLTYWRWSASVLRRPKGDLVEQKSLVAHAVLHSRHQSVNCFLPLLSATPKPGVTIRSTDPRGPRLDESLL